MKKYILIILILSFLYIPLNLWGEINSIEPVLSSSFNMKKILKKVKENCLKKEMEKIEEFFQKRYLIRLSHLIIEYYIFEIDSKTLDYFVINFKNDKFIKNFLNYPEKRKIELSGGFTLYAINKKTLVLSDKFKMIEPFLLKLEKRRIKTKKSLNMKINSPLFLENYKMFRSFVNILSEVDFIEFKTYNNKINISLKPSLTKLKEMRKSIKELFKYEYKYVDDSNKKGGFNFWIRNYDMFIRSGRVKKSGEKLIITGKLIENSEELIVRFLLPLMDRFIKKLIPDDERKKCEEIKNKIVAKIFFMVKKGETPKVALRKLKRDRTLKKLRCPLGGEYFYKENLINDTFLKCSIHDERMR
jgi:hypothetical protein